MTTPIEEIQDWREWERVHKDALRLAEYAKRRAVAGRAAERRKRHLRVVAWIPGIGLLGGVGEWVRNHQAAAVALGGTGLATAATTVAFAVAVTPDQRPSEQTADERPPAVAPYTPPPPTPKPPKRDAKPAPTAQGDTAPTPPTSPPPGPATPAPLPPAEHERKPHPSKKPKKPKPTRPERPNPPRRPDNTPPPCAVNLDLRPVTELGLMCPDS